MAGGAGAVKWGSVLPVVIVNGRRRSPVRAHVSALDRGFTLADGAFETMRAYGGRAFRLDVHLARLASTADALGIPFPADARSRVVAAAAAAAALGASDAAVRLTLTRGAGGGGVAPPPPHSPPTVVIVAGALPGFAPEIYACGISAHVAASRRNEYAATSGMKTLAYTESVVALAAARRGGADDAIFLDTAGHCSEAASSNVFAWTGSELLTPPLSCGVLPGITRAVVIELAHARGIAFAERAFDMEELTGAREAFLTSSLREIAPLRSVGGLPIGTGAPGTVTRLLSDAYRALVRAECGAES